MDNDETIKQRNIDLSNRLYREFKGEAARRGVLLREAFAEAIETWIAGGQAKAANEAGQPVYGDTALLIKLDSDLAEELSNKSNQLGVTVPVLAGILLRFITRLPTYEPLLTVSQPPYTLLTETLEAVGMVENALRELTAELRTKRQSEPYSIPGEGAAADPQEQIRRSNAALEDVRRVHTELERLAGEQRAEAERLSARQRKRKRRDPGRDKAAV